LLRPFFICGGVQHVLGFIELRRLLGRRRGWLLTVTGSKQQSAEN